MIFLTFLQTLLHPQKIETKLSKSIYHFYFTFHGPGKDHIQLGLSVGWSVGQEEFKIFSKISSHMGM